MVMNLCCVVMVVMRVFLERRLKGRLTKITLLDIVVTLICLGTMVYEAGIASDFKEFLEAETLLVDLLRTVKCFRLFLLFLERKYYWKKLHDLLMVIGKSLSRVLPIFCLWFIAILVFAIMGHHLQGGRILVNKHGEVDMDEGRPNQFNFSDIYHSLVLILLDSFDEEWDYLMFREYLGRNPLIVGFQLIAMLICYLLCFKYLIGSYTSELDLTLDEAKHGDEE